MYSIGRTAKYSLLDYKGNEKIIRELQIPEVRNFKEHMEETGQNMLAR
jgi:hypothetical protein